MITASAPIVHSFQPHASTRRFAPPGKGWTQGLSKRLMAPRMLAFPPSFLRTAPAWVVRGSRSEDYVVDEAEGFCLLGTHEVVAIERPFNDP